MKNVQANQWVVTIDDVVIPQSEYVWTDEGNFFFEKTVTELAQLYCPINGYKTGGKVRVTMKMEWLVELD